MEPRDITPGRCSTTYHHAPLDHLRASIRLIQVLPEEDPDGRIQCRMSVDNLDAEYTCLSYVWGPEDSSHEITIDKKSFFVRKNLFEFLKVARLKYSVRHF